MEQLNRILLNIDFRSEPKAKPMGRIIDEYLVIKTHPFHCWESNRFGKCYRYNMYNLYENYFVNNYVVYCYENVNEIILAFLCDIYNDLKYNILKKYYIPENHFSVKNKNDNDNELFFELQLVENVNATIMKQFENSKLENNSHGLIMYENKVYFIMGNFNYKTYIYDQECELDKRSLYYSSFIKNNENLPNKKYTLYNNKYYNSSKDYDDSSDEEESEFFENFVYKGNKIVGQIFSYPGFLDVLFINE